MGTAEVEGERWGVVVLPNAPSAAAATVAAAPMAAAAMVAPPAERL